MQTQQLPRLLHLAAGHPHEEVDEGPTAGAPASSVPPQKILSSGSTTKEIHTDSSHSRNCARRNHAHTQPSPKDVNIQDHPHSCAASTPTRAHNSLTHCSTLPTLLPHNLQDFIPLGTLGRGNMGTVILVVSKLSPHSPFALKITHSMASKKQRSHVEREILSSLHHPFLQTLHAHFDYSGRHSLLLLDFCAGGDLNLLRHRQPERRFSETAARFYAAEVLVTLEHLHKLGIVYRDLKPENILLEESGHIKLTDFDLSLRVGTGRSVSSFAMSAATPVRSLQEQLEAEADAHLKLQSGKQCFHRSAFACLRGYISRSKESAAQIGFKNRKEGEKGCACGTVITGRAGISKQTKVCCGRRDQARDRKTRKNWASKGSFGSTGNNLVCRKAARKGRNLRMPCLACMSKSQKKFRGPEEKSVCVVGTDEYVAPEVLKGEEHGFPMDWWSFGILLYEMIYGYTPFKGASSTDATLYNILEKEPEFPGMKSPAKNLIAQLLVKNPASRLGTMGAQDIKRHPFFHGLHWESLPHICRPPFLPSPLCMSELEERYLAKLKAKRGSQQMEDKLSDMACRSWLDEVVESLEAAENSSQNSQTSSSVGFISSSADGGDQRELQRDNDIDAVFSSTEWSSELDICMHHAPLT